MKKTLIASAVAANILVLSGCNSSDGGADLTGFVDSMNKPAVDWQAGEYRSSNRFQNYCETPRTGTNPVTQRAYPDRQGERAHEKHFLRSWSHENYFWYDELPDIDPNNSDSRIEYFNKLKTDGLTATGTPKDNFHFTQDEVASDQFIISGETGGYGIQWTVRGRDVYVLYVEPNSPAEAAGVTRGMLATHINGISVHDATNEQLAIVNTGLFGPELGDSYDIGFTEATGFMSGDGPDTTLTLQSSTIAIHPVHKTAVLETESAKVGYLMLNTFGIRRAETDLIAAFENFAAENINELVLDLRYNGGGFIYIASQLGYMIGGDHARGETFVALKHNRKLSANDETITFSNTYDTDNGPKALPTVNLNRVYVLSTGGTCSASESIINGLRGVGVEVILIGGKTCGKPYGYSPPSNCGVRYFSIQTQTVNAQGFGEYGDGFIPVEAGDPLTNHVTGCSASDDLISPLGVSSEPMLDTALYHLKEGTCPAPSTGNSEKPKPTLIVNGEIVAPPSHKVMRFDKPW